MWEILYAIVPYIVGIDKENFDFVYVDQNIFEKLNFIFKSNDMFKIERKCFSLNNTENLIEVNLKRIKIIVLSEILAENNQNLIKPRLLQISKFKNILDLKRKILRSINLNTDEKFYNLLVITFI